MIEIRRRTLICFECVLLGLAAWFVYAPAFHGEWLWDDNTDITGNSLLRDATGLGKIWVAPGSVDYLPQQTGAQSWVAAPTLDYYPLKNTVQWVQWHLWGLNPLGYHLTNVALHLLSAFLLWFLLRRLGVRFAYLGGLLFVVHPVAVESVAWIVELKNTLSLPLLLGAMIAYLAYDQRWNALSPARLSGPRVDPTRWGQRVPPYLLSLLCFLAAMLCKTSVVMFPVVILLFAWWKRGRIGWRDLRASGPFFAVSLVLGLVSMALHRHGEAASGIVIPGGLLSRFAGAGLALAFYFWKCLVPVGLMPIYPRWDVDPPSLWQFWPWVIIVGWGGVSLRRLFGRSPRQAAWGQAVGGLTAGPPDSPSGGPISGPGAGFRPPSRHVLFGLGFFALNLLPVLGFVRASFMSLTWVMDHFAYISLIGVIGLAVAGLGWLYALDEGRLRGASSRPRAGVLFKSLFWTVTAVAVAALALESRGYARVFSSGEMLWTYALRHNPEAWVAESNLASALVDKGRLPEAIVHYRQSLRLRPDNPETRNNLGNALLQTDRAPEAIAEYEEALRLKADYFESLVNLGNALAEAGQTAEAVERLAAASRLQPDNTELHNNLGCALAQLGRTDEARRQFEEALRLKPDDAEVRANLELLRGR